MSKRKNDKKITFLEPVFSEVLVCKNRNLRPQIEIMVQEPENISQENLGTILGIFEITDESEDSSYIVNFLISVIKKEYFSKPKRGPIESLEAALNKANIALSKLAEHESIGWIGKFNAACAVFEKDNFYFSKTGDATLLLLRSQTLTEISRDMTPADQLNPLKTFVDIVSGKLEESDKVIIATNEIFDIFSQEEIKHSALKFSQEDFLQFLQTALINELERVAILIIDVSKKEIEMPEYTPPQTNINAFSQSAFERPPKPEIIEKEKIAEELKEMLRQENGDFIDKKTGHIYIKEDMYRYQEQGSLSSFFSVFQEKITIATRYFKPSGFFSALLSPFRKWKESRTRKVEALQQEKTIEELEKESGEKSTPINIKREILPKESLKKIGHVLWIILEKIGSALKFLAMKFWRMLIGLKNIWIRMNRQKKIYTSLILLALLAISYIVLSAKKTPEVPAEVAQESAPPTPDYTELKGDASEIKNLSEIYSAPEGGIRRVSVINDHVIIIKNKEIIDLQNQTPYALPGNFQNPKLTVSMDDLQLIFLLNNSNQLLSFSPVSKKFQDSNLNLPEGAEIAKLGSYLTYLYIVDGKNGQIYRYPRAAGGFGEKTDWLKDTADLSSVSGIAINENLYISTDKEIQKFFRGKKQDFSIKNPEGKTITPDRIYNVSGSDNLYIMDKENMLVLKLDKDGNILAKFFSPEIKDIASFAINKQENKVLLITENKVLAGDL